jgi:HEAT repeat protein
MKPLTFTAHPKGWTPGMMKPIGLAVLLLAGAAGAQEDKLIAILRSEASTKEKADACQELARVGTRQAVPVLAGLLADTNLSHPARLALEPIPDSSVDAALRRALGKVNGQALVGVISSLGARKDARAIKPLARLLAASDPAVADAAARALGSVGGPAAKALERALRTGPQANQPAVTEGLLRCAESLPDDRAAVIYDEVRALPNQPPQVRVAALRGAILSRGIRGVPVMVEAFRTTPEATAGDVLRISSEMPGAAVTQALIGELSRADGEKQLLLLQALGDRGDASAAPGVVSLAQMGAVRRRVAAIHCLVQLGSPSSLPVLAGLVQDPDATVSSAALSGLIGFPGAPADATVLGLLGASDASSRIAGAEAAVERRITNAVPALLTATSAADAGVVSASFKALGELASVREIPGLVEAMLRAKDVAAAEAAISAICARQPDATICAAKLLPGLAKAQGAAKLALLRVLGTVGGLEALASVRAAGGDTDEAVKETALLVLCDWPTAEALPDLAILTRTNEDAKIKLLALRGQLRLIPLQSVSDAEKLSQLRELLPLLEHQEEQRQALAILGEIPSAESLALAAPFLSGEGLKEEAAAAAVAVAEKIVDQHPAEVAEAMKQVQTNNPQLAARARRLLTRATKGDLK